MLIPPFLNRGDEVFLSSPAGCIQPECLQRGCSVLESWGLKVISGPHVSSQYGMFAGTDKERQADLQKALDTPEIKAIFCTRGGYGTARIIDSLDFTEFLKSPKWIVGFSDITVLLSHLQQNLQTISLHAAMPQSYPPGAGKADSIALDSLYKALFGLEINYFFPSQFPNRSGIAQAPLIGGNLSVLYSLRGTNTDIDPSGKILFIEDLNEYDYHIDRMLLNLFRGGWFENLSGLIVGSFIQTKQGLHPYGKDVWEIISEYTAPFNYPVCYGFPAGHIPHNRALYMGKTAVLSVKGIGSVPSNLKFI
ncbi:MAG: LD-carboxypeptidase [Bacteroidales bacterium]